MECVFCDIIEKKHKAEIIYENDIIIVILDSDPINNGHLLILTKKHKKDIDELEIEELNEIGRISKEMVKLIKKIYKPEGYSIMQNGGQFNDVGHYHYHVFPRFGNDGFGWKYGNSKKEEIRNEKIKFIDNMNIEIRET